MPGCASRRAPETPRRTGSECPALTCRRRAAAPAAASARCCARRAARWSPTRLPPSAGRFGPAACHHPARAKSAARGATSPRNARRCSVRTLSSSRNAKRRRPKPRSLLSHDERPTTNSRKSISPSCSAPQVASDGRGSQAWAQQRKRHTGCVDPDACSEHARTAFLSHRHNSFCRNASLRRRKARAKPLTESLPAWPWGKFCTPSALSLRVRGRGRPRTGRPDLKSSKALRSGPGVARSSACDAAACVRRAARRAHQGAPPATHRRISAASSSPTRTAGSPPVPSQRVARRELIRAKHGFSAARSDAGAARSTPSANRVLLPHQSQTRLCSTAGAVGERGE